MKIFISLDNLLLGAALLELLSRTAPEHDAVLVTPDGAAGDCRPDVLLIDPLSLDAGVCERYPDSKTVLVDTGLALDELVAIVRRHRVDGVISRAVDPRLFAKALKVIGKGEVWMDNTLVKALLAGSGPTVRSGLHDVLTARERQVMKGICDGMANKDVAAHLAISEQTVKAHVKSIFKKLNVTSRTQLVSLALAEGFRA